MSLEPFVGMIDALFEVYTPGLNELGVPDFRAARHNTQAKPTAERSGLNGSASLTPPCPQCRYPLVKSDRACPRCGKGRA